MSPARGNAQARINKDAQHAEEAVKSVLAKAPVDQRLLSDGRDTRTVLVGMVREWQEIYGGCFEARPAGIRWAYLSDDAMVIGGSRPLGLSTDLCAISDHAMARAVASGYRGAIIGNGPPVAYWSTITMTEDAIPVMLAVLDRELTGGIGCLDWYLQTPCSSRLCRQHPDGSGAPFCGSATCAVASLDTPCDCVCGGVNHGMGEEAFLTTRPEAPNWSSAPAPVWRPGSGSVEVDREHRRVVGRDPFSRHGARVRPPSLAWTATESGSC